MKLFPVNLTKEHASDAVVAYRFMFRTTASKDLRVAFRVGSPADIQAYADMLAQSEDVLSAACEYQYTIDLKRMSVVVPIKSQDEPAEEV